MRRVERLSRLTAAIGVALVVGVTVVGAPARTSNLSGHIVDAASDWTELQGILSGIQGSASAPIPNTVTDFYTSGMLLGNGDLGIVAGGDTTSDQRFYFGKSDFWGSAWAARHSSMVTAILSLGNLTISSPTPSPNPGPVYHMTQDILDAEVRSTVQLGGATVSMRSWTADSDNIFVTELSTPAGSPPVPIRIDLALPPPDTHASYPTTVGAASGTIWATRHNDYTGGNQMQAEDGIAVTPVGVGFSSTSTSGNTVTGSFTLAGGATVELATVFRGDTRAGSGGPSAAALAGSARSAVQALDATGVASLLSNHRAWWQSYWLHSLIQVNDPVMMEYWYGSLYVMGCASRPGHVPPGMNGNWVLDDFTHWPRFWMNYNFEAPFYGVASANHADLLLPYTVQQFDQAPVEQNFTAAAGYQGIAFERTMGPDAEFVSPPAPAPVAGSKNVAFIDQKSNGSFGAMPAIWYWEYTQDRTYLATQLYPHLKQLEAFWRSYLTNVGGVYQVQHSSAHEGSDDLNPDLDIGFIRKIETTLISASQVLGVDANMVPVWQDVLDHLSPLPTGVDSGKTVYLMAQNIRGSTAITSTFSPGDQPINMEGAVFPGENVYVGGDPTAVQTALNSLQLMNSWGVTPGGNSGNGFPKEFPIAARVGWPAADLETKLDAAILHDWRPSNVTAAQPNGGIETTGTIEAVDSMLMQSESGAIRVFGDADWPVTKDAHFKRLLAKGAFVVSSDLHAGAVTYVDATSQVGGTLNLYNPWPSSSPGVVALDASGNVLGPVAYTQNGRVLTLPTTAGETYHFTQTGSPVTAPGLATSVAGTANGGGQVTVTWNPPADSGGAPIGGYAVYAFSYSGGTTEVVSSTNSATVTGLTPNTYYTFTVTSWNGSYWGGWSGWSDWVLVT